MRIGLTLDHGLDAASLSAVAVDAERLGLWAVEVSGEPGVEMVRAGRLCSATTDIRIIVRIQLGTEHPFTVAEEIAVLDNLSSGRIGVIVEGGSVSERADFSDALVGRPLNGALIAPPPVQTTIETWTAVAEQAEDLSPTRGETAPGRAVLGGDPAVDAPAVDRWLAAGCTHLLVEWPADVRVLARHLMTRAAMVDYPDIVSTMADQLAPFD